MKMSHNYFLRKRKKNDSKNLECFSEIFKRLEHVLQGILEILKLNNI